jgi:hypothetical protein
MFYLVKTAGLDQALYVGDLPNGVREGRGVQHFANGYKYTGEWAANKACGQGKLEYTDGTFYEGTFKDNRFVEGILSFYNGAKFVGKFCDDERFRERFMEGTFIFMNGDMLKAVWRDGVPRTGNFITKAGKILKFAENERSIFYDEEDPTRGKIIMANSTEIYEGGIKDKDINGKGIIYSSFPHYEEAYYTAGKPNGQFICNYIHGGYCYEGNFKNGQRVGKWKYQTSKGFFYDGEANLKSGKISFPYLNDDHFIGDVDIQFHSITLLVGTYNLMDAQGKIVSIPVQNVKALNEIPELKDRKINWPSISKRYQKSKVVSEEPILNGLQIYSYPDGSYFQGNFTYDFIYIHKKELLKCYFPANQKKMSKEKPHLSISESVNIFQSKTPSKNQTDSPSDSAVLIRGAKVNDTVQGFCTLISPDKGVMQGVFKDNQLNGFAKHISAEGVIYQGNFVNGVLAGQGLVITPNGDIIQGDFVAGNLQEDKVVIRKQNGLVYTGSTKNFKKHGQGELIYTNGFKYVGEFSLGEIDTTAKHGRIVTPTDDEFECIYTLVANRNIGILETVAEGEVFVYNNTLGSIKKAQ